MLAPSNTALEQAVIDISQRHSLLRARDLAVHGLPTVVLTSLVAAGKLECVARGV